LKDDNENTKKSHQNVLGFLFRHLRIFGCEKRDKSTIKGPMNCISSTDKYGRRYETPNCRIEVCQNKKTYANVAANE
jgi:hypothetical protein